MPGVAASRFSETGIRVVSPEDTERLRVRSLHLSVRLDPGIFSLRRGVKELERSLTAGVLAAQNLGVVFSEWEKKEKPGRDRTSDFPRQRS